MKRTKSTGERALRNISLSLVTLIVLLPARALGAEAELCSHLRAFQVAPFEKDIGGRPIRRAIELHWIGNWMDFGGGFEMRCSHGDTTTGKALCGWLPENTSMEFPAITPMRILECYGWKIPASVNDWDVTQARFRINTDETGNELTNSDRYLLLEIDMQPRKSGHKAIRLSVIPWDENRPKNEPRLHIGEAVNTGE